MKKALMLVGALAVLVGLVSTQVCLSAGFRYGVWLDHCPDGAVRPVAAVSTGALMRGVPSSVQVSLSARSTWGPADLSQVTPMTSFEATLSLVANGVETPMPPDKQGWRRSGLGRTATVEVPKVADGDYLLRARVHSRLGDSVVEVPVQLYAPARVHLLTDRPLYEPGNTVRFRAVVLRAKDSSPLDGRPGVFIVRNLRGEVLLEEKAAAGPWGVVSGSFPLDEQAESGEWSVTWQSGGASATRAFTVKPFTLPRFRIEAATSKPFYRRLERPVLKGEVRYASGAPVPNARLELSWSVSGNWPPPTSWVDGTALPRQAQANASGHFSVELPQVPEDLQNQATLSVRLAASDASGDRVEGSASILLSKDAIAVDAVSELAEGLVQGFNNRLFLRATTADGRVLEGAQLTVKRLWEPTDQGVTAAADEDGVASLQVDPGPPVNVIIPALPFRPPPPVKVVTRTSVEELLSEGAEPSLGDRLALDRLEPKLTACARYADDAQGITQVTVGLRVSPSGSIAAASVPTHRLGACVKQALDSLMLSGGRDRLLSVSWSFDDSDLPRLSAQAQGVPSVPNGINQALAAAMLDVRDCLPASVQSGTLPRAIAWSVASDKAKEAPVAWVANSGADHYPDAALTCIQGRIQKLRLPARGKADEDEDGDPTQGSSVGIAHLSVEAPSKYEADRPQETVMVGYEFQVTARLGGEVVGTTRLVLRPGAVPPLRVRATPQIVKAGATVDVEVLRGPDYSGDVPERAYLQRPGEKTLDEKVDPRTRHARFTVPEGAEGWASISAGSHQTFLFIQPNARLTVALKPDRERYAPGQLAHLEVQTRLGAQGGPAAVGLFGVDESLAQLVPLPGADELSDLRPRVQATGAFGGLDAQALSMGRVRGANAAAATLLKVTGTPSAVELESSVSASGQSPFDPVEPLTDHFYAVLAALHEQARAWEAKAPAAERMTPRTMATLWDRALDAVEARDGPQGSRDAWGRRLRLHRLPVDLLALTDPRQVVVEGTRLPEDVENWNQWVARERP